MIWRLHLPVWLPGTASAVLESLSSPDQHYNVTYVGSIGDIELSCADFGPDNACDPQNFEPNLALNLEVVDLINSKKGNA